MARENGDYVRNLLADRCTAGFSGQVLNSQRLVNVLVAHFYRSD
jgi:hypothetical protein